MVGAPPEDLAERVVVFLDCGNIDRMPVDFLKRDGLHILNIDHHHDNTRFGTVNLVVADGVVHRRDRVAAAPRSWAPRSRRRSPTRMYVGLVTDTGRFMYENTTPAAHRMAAELIEAGVDPHASTGACTRTAVPPAAAAPARAGQRRALRRRRHDAGLLTRDDFEETGAIETDSEGIVDHMRAVEGTKVAVLVRELLADDRHGLRKVSLRATDGRVDVSLIARGLGGGGHRAGGRRHPPSSRSTSWSSDLRRRGRRPAVLTGARGHPVRQAGRRHLARRRGRGAPGAARGDEGRPRRHARPVRHRAAAGAGGQATRAQRFLMALPKTYRAVARLGWTSDTGDRDGELVADRAGARRPRDPRPGS